MICSRNELQAALQKALKAGGAPTGVADEVAVAGAWIAATGSDGIGAVLAGLQTALPSRHTPMTDYATFQNVRVVLAGPSALDLLATDLCTEITLHHCDSPLLLAGLAAVRSAEDAINYAILVDGVEHSLATLNGLQNPLGLTMQILRRDEPRAADEISENIDVNPTDWAHLLQLAAAMYVPSSEQSRSAGAGAGLLDND